MRTYGQFCPVAKAAEIFAERWTPLIVRELLMGCHRYSELEQGLPGIPKSMLVKRLKALEQAGVVEIRGSDDTGRKKEYHLTPAGQELFDIVWRLGEWGQRWANHEIGPSDVDPRLLMWDMRRRIHLDRIPDHRVVSQFNFQGLKQDIIWLVLERPEPSVCYHDPGFEIDLFVNVDTLSLHKVWMGHMSLDEAFRKSLIEIEGQRELARAFPEWLALSHFAGIAPVR
jgi:DNA-binding HxlR family transcriptional regulator